MVRFSKFFCLVKACENRHWFLFHKQLAIVHRMAARRRRSREGQSRQYFQAKKQKILIFSYKYVIYLKWKLKLCRIQIYDEKIWFDGKKYEKSPFFSFLPQNEADQMSSTANFSNFFATKFKNGLTRSCKKVWSEKSPNMSPVSPTSQKWRTIISQGGLQEPPPHLLGLIAVRCNSFPL